ncbi:hypothetical protein BXZ70DRAFT_930442 [Cristinia sonorae]|uniref:Uncharacterized protein n=1 Tax=Cristinia sonorae TaxID=1940300 RepID=A0A8K0UR08_9AGAR|nr:hypothetical protein BXZ70DRAFT_930442 [Cristinia sonorae]
MFNRFSTKFCSLIVLGAVLVGAVPAHISARQVGDLQCNIDRVKVTGSVFQALQTTRSLTQQLQNDAAGTALLTTINQGLLGAEDGIADLVTALFAGQTAPESAVDQVGGGLTLAFDAASNITSADPAVTDSVNKLKNELLQASFAGDNVLDECH